MGTVIRQANKTEAELKNGYIVLLSKKTVYPYKIALIISVSAFVDRFACQLHAKLLECLDIHVRKHHRSMCLTAMQFRKLFESKSGVFICRGACGECDQHFVRMQSRVAALQIIYFQLLDRFDRLRGDDVQFMSQTGKFF